MAVIRVSGDLGAGKTTLCSRLAEALGYRYSYTGGIFREMAAERGMSIEGFYAALAADAGLEKSVDDRQNRLMATMDNLLVEGRMAPFFVGCPYRTINVLVRVEPEEGARRLAGRPEYRGVPFETIRKKALARFEMERMRFKDLYGIENHRDEAGFDVIVDATHLGPDELFSTALKEIQRKIDGEP